MASSIETTSTTTTLKNNGNTYLSVDTNDVVTMNVASLNGGQLAGMRNRIINGDMRIDQRNAAAAVTITTGNQFSVDRFQGITSVSSKYSLQQTTTTAVGFVNSIKALSLSAYTVGTSEQNFIRHHVEGLNMGDLNWGTSGAKTVTLSFQVRSSLTGTFGGSIFNYNGSRSYPFSYSIGSADTWTTISLTITGDTTGTWLATNGVGMTIAFTLGTGSGLSGTAGAWMAGYNSSASSTVSILGTSGATLYITGVQLEVGSVATPFEHRLYGTELALCQRYLPSFRMASLSTYLFAGKYTSTTETTIIVPFSVSTRVPVTGVIHSGVGDFTVINSLGQTVATTAISIGTGSETNAKLLVTSGNSNNTAGDAAIMATFATDTYIYFTGAEL